MKRKMTLWLIITFFSIAPVEISLAYEAEDAIIISETEEREKSSLEEGEEINVSILDLLETDTVETEIEQKEEEETDEVILSIEDAESDSPTAISTTMASGTCGDSLIWTLSTEGVLTISGTGEMTEWDGNFIATKADTEVSAPWFEYRSKITSVEIENGVSSIGQWSFYECTNLTSVTIPVSVTSIGYSAFRGCSSLTSIALPENLTSLAGHLFAGCSSLSDVTLPSGLKSFGYGSFMSCKSLTSITIPSNITYISEAVFFGCSSLTSITIPSGVWKINSSAFYGCTSLESVILPDSIEYLEAQVFYGCTALISISIPYKVKSLGTSLFSGCSNLTTVVLPANLTSINDKAFYGCYNLSDVYYNSTESDWAEISIGTDNSSLTDATIHYSYLVTFDANGGRVAPVKITVTHGLSYGTLSTPTRTGYTFTGWFTSADGGSQVLSTTIVSETGEHTLYAHWTANTYLVTFDPNGGSVSTGDKTVTYGSSYGTLPTPSRTGYTFNGWYTASSGGTKVTDSTVVSTGNEHTLYAHWTANTYKVTFNANGGGVSIGSKTVTFGDTYTSLPTSTRSGYAFGGWYTASDGGTKVTENTVVNVASNHTLYAHWTGKAIQTISVSSSISKVYKSGKTFNLNASAEGKLTYKSSDTSIAKVSSSGKVTMKGYGTVKITITAAATSTYKKATKTVTVKLKPAKMAAPILSSEKTGYISIEWVKNTSVTGYQVQWSLNSNFAAGSTGSYLLKKSKRVLNLENLKSGTVYYVRIRAYKKVDGKKIYGAWSTVKSITVR